VLLLAVRWVLWQVDDATWTEVRNFQKCLIQMFMAEGKEVLFMETAMNLGTGEASHPLWGCRW
jgi:hypothetical protein